MEESRIEKIIKEALKEGADEVHISYTESESYSVTINIGEISDVTWRHSRGLELIVIKDKRLGIATTNELTDESINNLIKRALSLAKSSPKNPWWEKLPEPKPYPVVSNVFDKRIKEMTPEEIMELASMALNEVSSYDRRVALRSGVVNSSVFRRIISNSNGVYGEDEGTSISMALVAVAREGDKVGSFVVGHRESRIFNIDVSSLAKEISEKALDSLNARSVKSFKGSLIMGYDVAASFFSALINATCGDNVWKGRSPLSNKIGKVIASESLTIIDDGVKPGGYHTAKFDAEGSPRRKTIVIEGGVLKNFLHNTYTANILKAEPTGNATSLLTVGHTNLDIRPGDSTLEELIESVKEGILVERFSGNMRFEDGLISGVAKQAYKIENGKIVYPVRECMIYGNIYQMARQISGLTKERRECYGIITPIVRVDNVTIVGR